MFKPEKTEFSSNYFTNHRNSTVQLTSSSPGGLQAFHLSQPFTDRNLSTIATNPVDTFSKNYMSGHYNGSQDNTRSEIIGSANLTSQIMAPHFHPYFMTSVNNGQPPATSFWTKHWQKCESSLGVPPINPLLSLW